MYGYLVSFAMLELLRYPSSKSSRALRKTMIPRERRFFQRPRMLSWRLRFMMLPFIVQRHLMLVDPRNARTEDFAALYNWNAEHLRYAGKAS